MNEENKKKDDEINLIELFAILWHRRKMIITVTLIAAIGAVIFSIISIVLPPEISPLPNKYTPEALMLINDSSSSGGGLSSMLNSSSLGGLASLVGLNVSSSSVNSQLAVYLVETNSLLDSVVDEFGLIERYKIKKYPRTESRKMLKKWLKAEYDNVSGVLSIDFTDYDPVFAQSVVNYCVTYLEQRFEELGLDKNKIEKENLEMSIANTFQEIMRLEEESRRLEHSVAAGSFYGGLPAITIEATRILMELEAQKQIYTEFKVQYEILKVTMLSEQPVFQVLEMAEVPDKKSRPSRVLLCIIVTFAAAFLAVSLVFTQNAIANIKSDPEAMAKLRGKNEQ
jgi:uncharacterized protein involved in exopolysaccharide biosynthesis